MIVHGYFPDEPRLASEARAAVAAGFDVDVVALRGPTDEARTEGEGVRCFRLPVEHRRGAGLVSTVSEYVGFTARAAARSARLGLRRRYDVVQVHSPPDALVLAALVPRLLGARILLDVHDLTSDMFMMRFGQRAGARLVDRALRLFERLAGRLASALITVHEPYRRELAARGVNAEKITVVMNSLDESLLPQVAADGRDGFRVVYHGTVTPHYGVGLIVDAAGMLRDRVDGLQVEIYGDGDAIPELRSRARELGVDDRVRIAANYLPQADVLRAVRGASAGIVPNLPTRLNRFALSTKLLEYVALGIPAVSADLPTIRAHFSDDEVMFFRAGDANALADALAEVAADPERALRRAEAARRRYEAYRWEHSAEAYIGVLEKLARR
jgi:glycosyltransferase involved in cell wall biosynthesis